jgi:hypothetical protein
MNCCAFKLYLVWKAGANETVFRFVANILFTTPAFLSIVNPVPNDLAKSATPFNTGNSYPYEPENTSCSVTAQRFLILRARTPYLKPANGFALSILAKQSLLRSQIYHNPRCVALMIFHLNNKVSKSPKYALTTAHAIKRK